MAFTPNTSIYIGTVPFNPDYKHIRYIPNRTQQFNYFRSLCPQELRRDDYTYQRENNAVVVPYNAETLYGYNYAMFQNSNYGNRWFYSFITKIEYVNPNSSRLYLETDIMQTWFPDCNVRTCYVEREHVNDDSFGKHIKDEGFDMGEPKIYGFDYTETWSQAYYPAVSCCVEPLKNGEYINLAGYQYQGMFSGTLLSVFANTDELKSYLQALLDNGQQDAITSIYMIPNKLYVKATTKTWDGYGKYLPVDKIEDDYSLAEPPIKSFDGYIPKNTKTYIYPTQYIKVSNGLNEEMILRYELYNQETLDSITEFIENNTPPSWLGFKVIMGSSPDSKITFFPKNYNGFTNTGNYLLTDKCISFAMYPTCTWAYQTFQNWWNQNTVQMSNVFGGGTATPLDVSTLSMFNDYGKGLINSAATMVGTGGTKLSNQGTLAGAVGVVNSTGDLFTEMYSVEHSLLSKQRTPNQVRGNTNTASSLINQDMYGLQFIHYGARGEYVKQVDDYYSTYGYLIAEMKVPNITGRKSWNFVKTNASNIYGKVPPDVLKNINSLFDRGITFWHTNDVGNYALDNSIV